MDRITKNMNNITEMSFRASWDDECSKHPLPLTVHFSFLEGKVTEVKIPHRLGWRTIPVNVCCLSEMPAGTSALIELVDQPPICCQNGDITFIPAGLSHRFSCDGPRAYHSSWLHFNAFITGNLEIFTFYDMPNLIPTAKAERIAGLIRELLRQPRNMNLLESVQLQLTGNSLVLELLRFGRIRDAGTVHRKDLIRMLPALNHLQSCTEPPSTAALAGMVNLSTSRFLALFKQLTGMSPGHYREQERFRRAAVLLNSSEMTMAEIAAKLRYSDAFHFSRKFKALSGVSPREYRRMMKM